MIELKTPAKLSQSGRLRFLLKDSLIYGGAGAISRAFALITFPLLARHFSVAEYGMLDYFLVLASFLSVFFIFGQDSAVARYFYEHEDTHDRQQLISQSLLFQLAGLLLLLPVLWLGAEWITELLIAAPDRILLFKIILLQLPFMLLINFSQNLLKWTFARTRFLTMSLGFTIVQASLLVLAVLGFDASLIGVLTVSLVTSALFGVLGFFFVRKWLVRPTSFHRLREMLPFAIPYGIICVISAFSPTLERSLTNSLLGIEQLGLYAAATKIAMLISLLVNAFQTAWGPFSLSLYKQADAGQTYNWVLKIFALAACIAVLLISLLAQPLIQLLATDRYSGAALVVFPLVMGLAIQATSWITEIGIGISKRSYLSLYSYSAAIITTFVGIWFFTLTFGLLGVGLGVMTGHIVKALVASWLAQRAYPLPWNYGSTSTIIILTLILGLLSIWIRNEFGIVFSNGVLGASIVIVLLLGWFALLNHHERQRVTVLMRGRLSSLFNKHQNPH